MAIKIRLNSSCKKLLVLSSSFKSSIPRIFFKYTPAIKIRKPFKKINLNYHNIVRYRNNAAPIYNNVEATVYKDGDSANVKRVPNAPNPTTNFSDAGMITRARLKLYNNTDKNDNDKVPAACGVTALPMSSKFTAD